MTKACIVVDLGFGDAGKGSVVDFLAAQKKSDLVVRFNGGAQAAHNVVIGTRHHTFRQFGSGTFTSARTLYSSYALFDPLLFLEEVKALEGQGVIYPRTLFFVEEDCVITTIFQQAMNRVREIVRGEGRHGSCGLGIGETQSDKEKSPDFVLTVSDITDETKTFEKLEVIRKIKYSEALKISEGVTSQLLVEELATLGNSEFSKAAQSAYSAILARIQVVSRQQALSMLRDAESPIFEGAQGILIDQNYGFYPYITRSDVTPSNAVRMCRDAGLLYEIMGVVRAYTVRHGPGPMPTFDKKLTLQIPDAHNAFGEWQREFRVGYFDSVMTRLAIDICSKELEREGVTALFVTCLDRLTDIEEVKVCDFYEGNRTVHVLEPQSLSRIGKVEKKMSTNFVSRLEPHYSHFDSRHAKASREYGEAFAKFVLSNIKRRLTISGLSFGQAREDKFFL